MADKNLDLGGDDLGRGYDDVDIFGLDEYGDPVGLKPIYGALIGVGAGTIGAIAARSFGGATLAPNSELVGLGASVVAGGIMAVFPATRHAAWVALAAGVVGQGLRVVEKYFSASSPTAGMGMPSIAPYPRVGPTMSGPMGIVQAMPMNGGMGTPKLMGPPKGSPIAARYGATSMPAM